MHLGLHMATGENILRQILKLPRCPCSRIFGLNLYLLNDLALRLDLIGFVQCLPL